VDIDEKYRTVYATDLILFFDCTSVEGQARTYECQTITDPLRNVEKRPSHFAVILSKTFAKTYNVPTNPILRLADRVKLQELFHVILHEILHGIGFSWLWDPLREVSVPTRERTTSTWAVGVIRRPKTILAVQQHFDCPNWEFGAEVATKKSRSSVELLFDSHLNPRIYGNDIMTPVAQVGAISPITVYYGFNPLYSDVEIETFMYQEDDLD
jgi:hypothetical protein